MLNSYNCPRVFRACFESVVNHADDVLFWVFHSGRGTGKSENLCAIIIFAMLTRQTRVACVREVQNSMKDSVKHVLELWIERLNLQDFFIITKEAIKAINGSECLFFGLRDNNSTNIKSVSNIEITFIEEAQQLSELSWRTLVPSVVRTKDPKILIAFNPRYEHDIIYKEFIAQTPPARSRVTYLSIRHNPFFADSALNDLYLSDKQRLPAPMFQHIWEGALQSATSDSLFANVDFTPVSIDNIARVVIGVDPAATARDFSNESGIIVAAMDTLGTSYILADFTAHYSPASFAQKVVELYREYGAEAVVVETNQGGDFIKHTILTVDPCVIVKEVRAYTTKSERAAPLATLMETRKLSFAAPLPKLKRQMQLTTYSGFLGAKGESPDSLDAAIWAIYHLLQLKESDTLSSVFSHLDFALRLPKAALADRVAFATISGSVCAAITATILTNGAQKQICVLDSFLAKDVAELPELVYHVPDKPANLSLLSRFECATYPYERRELKERVQGILQLTREHIVFVGGANSNRAYKHLRGNLLSIALNNYSYDILKESDVLVDLLIDMIEIVFNL